MVATIIIGIALLAFVTAIIVRMISAKRKGKSISCGCGCSSCKGSCAGQECSADNTDKKI
ncbi:MAG: FeoB-associated Cys-rich membrane protein [Treponemataceae bacterium]